MRKIFMAMCLAAAGCHGRTVTVQVNAVTVTPVVSHTTLCVKWEK